MFPAVQDYSRDSQKPPLSIPPRVRDTTNPRADCFSSPCCQSRLPGPALPPHSFTPMLNEEPRKAFTAGCKILQKKEEEMVPMTG